MQGELPAAGRPPLTDTSEWCPLGCGPLSKAGILRDNRFALPHRVAIGWCEKCGLGVTLGSPSDDELGSLYEASYTPKLGAGSGAEQHRRVPRTGTAARLWHRVNGSLPLTDRALAGPVLDVGCNTGEGMVALRARGLEVVGVEPNPRAAALARSRGFEVIEDPVEHAELPTAHFGTILCSQVLEHVRDPLAVLERLAPSLRADGAVYVVVPNADSLWRHVFGADWVHWHVPFHLHHFTRASLELLLAQAGLTIRRLDTVTPGEWLLMSIQARRNARRDVYRLPHFSGRYASRLALAPVARLVDRLGQGDAFVAEAVPASGL
jgi:SAM-dependent methyltransferase